MNAPEAAEESCKLKAAIVGDVHGQWSEDDVTALQFLDVDVVLFVGDFGEEDLALVSNIADVPMPKAVILGNHDAWSWRWQRRSKGGPPPSDLAKRQLEVLKEAHVGYSSCSVPGKSATIVGSRPFSWGGPGLSVDELYAGLYGVRSPQQSTKKILECMRAAPCSDTLVVLAHSGPHGLGGAANDICGVDFQPQGGDWGDRDLTAALEAAAAEGRAPALVAFGHMHHTLMQGGYRKRVVVDEVRGTVHLNAAVVPRVRRQPPEWGPAPDDPDARPLVHHFCVASLQEWGVEAIQDVWVRVEAGGSCQVAREVQLLSSEGQAGARGSSGVRRRVLDTSASAPTHHLVASPCVLPPAASSRSSWPPGTPGEGVQDPVGE